MNAHLYARSQLLVDIETGRVLRGDDHPSISRRYADSHPFIEEENGTLFAGPHARRAALCRRRGETIKHLDVYEYEIQDEVVGILRLNRKTPEKLTITIEPGDQLNS